MASVRIVTDSNSGITQSEADKLGISVLPMPFLIDGTEYYEDINLTQESFYEFLRNDANVSTSQPSVLSVTEFWDELLMVYDEIVHIPMSSGLSATCQTATALAKEYGGRVHVVNNQRISVTQKQSVLDALALCAEGKSAIEVKEYLERTKYDSCIYIALSTLKYLKKGGRLTPAAALIGSILKIKPVLQINGDKLDKFAVCKTAKKAKETMISALREALDTRFKEYAQKGEMSVSVAHTDNEAEALLFAEELKGAFPEIPVAMVDPLSLSVSCHIGAGALACTLTRRYKN